MSYKTRSEREVAESPLGQGTDEEWYYRFDWGLEGTPTSPTVTIYDITNGADVSSDCLTTGDPTIDSDKVITPKVKSLTDGVSYRLKCKATVGGNVLSAYCIIVGEA